MQEHILDTFLFHLKVERGMAENSVVAYETDLRDFFVFNPKEATKYDAEDITSYLLALQEIGLENIEKTVLNFARLAEEVGLDGVVASPQEVALIRKHCGPDFKIICPGIRPKWAATNDQKRITTPQEAISLGADYLVVGRPITAAADPRQAALRVMEEITAHEI